MGNLFECFIDIEENTEKAVGALKDLMVNPGFNGGAEHTTAAEESSPSVFTYQCTSCHAFLRSDVVSCPTCGTANPHHPSNKSKAGSGSAGIPATAATEVARCLRCGAGLNPSDKFCSTCGYTRM